MAVQSFFIKLLKYVPSARYFPPIRNPVRNKNPQFVRRMNYMALNMAKGGLSETEINALLTRPVTGGSTVAMVSLLDQYPGFMRATQKALQNQDALRHIKSMIERLCYRNPDVGKRLRYIQGTKGIYEYRLRETRMFVQRVEG